MNDTPQGDGNLINTYFLNKYLFLIRMNDTPQGDGNLLIIVNSSPSNSITIRMNDTPQGDGNIMIKIISLIIVII